MIEEGVRVVIQENDPPFPDWTNNGIFIDYGDK